jgi:small subunit ribosomal protein S11
VARPRTKKKKIKKTVTEGIIHIHSTFNNTIINITDKQGNTIAWASGGTEGFKGTRKGTPFAAQLAVQSALKKAQAYGLKEAWVYVKGLGPGREAALRALQGSGIKITLIKDVTPIPHDGCRPPKRRRV